MPGNLPFGGDYLALPEGRLWRSVPSGLDAGSRRGRWVGYIGIGHAEIHRRVTSLKEANHGVH